MSTMNFSIDLNIPATLGPGIYSASNRNEYQKHKRKMFLGSREQAAPKGVNLTAICEPTVQKTWDPEHLSTP
jgi:hypothetical protein